MKNIIADFLSRPNQITTGSVAAASATDPRDFEEMATEQNRCPEMQRLLGGTSLKLAFAQTGTQRLAGDVSTGNFRPIVPLKFRKNNPYSLITIFGRGHLAIKAGGAVYVTRSAPAEVVPRSHKNCTEEIPVMLNGTEAFVDPISYAIKSAGSPVHSNDIAPSRYKVGGKWHCSLLELRECHDSAMLPVDKVKIDPVNVNNIRLGKSIYTKKKLQSAQYI